MLPLDPEKNSTNPLEDILAAPGYDGVVGEQADVVFTVSDYGNPLVPTGQRSREPRSARNRMHGFPGVVDGLVGFKQLRSLWGSDDADTVEDLGFLARPGRERCVLTLTIPQIDGASFRTPGYCFQVLSESPTKHQS